MNMVKTEDRARLKSAVLHALMMISIKGPDIEAVDFGRIVDAWHQEKPRHIYFYSSIYKTRRAKHNITIYKQWLDRYKH
ncbi:hypothetical protein DPMN_190008 [Dreissena polymorpha]|uniref:Uncharacterized protein n=1 Tax=Dreissena polymorpha TaxID=45954 RepID=A0A9D4DWJ7_DREPO|nr:hypothetical protein DPMN_190008 [Dreissena polymorpha]